jgi:poly-beta-hydroxybutyrate-responsive repressor
MPELEPRNFLQPCLLLLLRERSDHGYELVARLRPMHDGDGDAGGVYRALRSLERHGLVRSEWRSSDVGPSRRTYHLTSDGLAVLEAQVGGLQHVQDVLQLFMQRYARVLAAERSTDLEEVTDDRRPDRTDCRAHSNGVRPPNRADRRAGE